VAGERVPHLVTVFGPAGIGKTRLGQEFDDIVQQLGGRSVHGRSLPYRESSAYFAFSMQVKQLCGIFESDPPEVGLAKLREHVADLPSSADPEAVTQHLAILLGLDPEGSVDDREELFFSVRCFIESVARDQPTMLLLEGNPLFIEQLAATMAETSPGETESLPTTVRGIVAARLDALPAQERALLLDAAVVGRTFWRGALERIGSGTDGIPGLLGALEGRDLIVRETSSIIEG